MVGARIATEHGGHSSQEQNPGAWFRGDRVAVLGVAMFLRRLRGADALDWRAEGNVRKGVRAGKEMRPSGWIYIQAGKMRGV